MADPPGGQQALEGEEKVLEEQALSEAPVAQGASVLVPRATPAAHELFASHFTDVMRFKAGLAEDLVEAIYTACQTFKQGDSKGRSVPPLTVGLLWLTEGLAALARGTSSFQVRFDLTVPRQAEHARFVEALEDLAAADSSIQPNVEGAYVTFVGLWGFGLDAVFGLSPLRGTDVEWATASARWKTRLRRVGWTNSLPFDAVRPTYDRSTKTFTMSASKVWPFLVCKAARYAEELWKLPDELGKRGDADLGSRSPLWLNEREPIMGYNSYRYVAHKSAGFYEIVRFLRDLGPAVTAAGTPEPALPGTELQPLIGVLARWQGRLASSDFRDCAGKVIHDSAAPSGRTTLQRAASATDWKGASATALPEKLKDQLLRIVAAWADYAVAFETYADKTTQHFLHDASLPSAPLQLVSAKPGLEGFMLFGFGVQNFTKRYRDVTGRDPWTPPPPSTPTPASAVGE